MFQLAEPIRLRGDDLDAAARPPSKPVVIGDADLTMGVMDESRVLELAHHHRESRALDADHLRQELLGHPERPLVEGFVDLQQPARGPLVEPMRDGWARLLSEIDLLRARYQELFRSVSPREDKGKQLTT